MSNVCSSYPECLQVYRRSSVSRFTISVLNLGPTTSGLGLQVGLGKVDPVTYVTPHTHTHTQINTITTIEMWLSDSDFEKKESFLWDWTTGKLELEYRGKRLGRPKFVDSTVNSESRKSSLFEITLYFYFQKDLLRLTPTPPHLPQKVPSVP